MANQKGFRGYSQDTGDSKVVILHNDNSQGAVQVKSLIHSLDPCKILHQLFSLHIVLMRGVNFNDDIVRICKAL